MDHTGVRPHPCPQCKLTFKTSNSLKKHKLSVHSDIKHFACQYCGSRFSTSSGVLRHQKKQRCSALKPGEMLGGGGGGGEEEEEKVELIRRGKEELLLRQEAAISLVKQETELGWRGLTALPRQEERGHTGYRLPD